MMIDYLIKQNHITFLEAMSLNLLGMDNIPLTINFTSKELKR